MHSCDPVKLEIGSAQIKATTVVKLSGITLGDNFSFEESQHCKKEPLQLNTISHLRAWLWNKKTQ